MSTGAWVVVINVVAVAALFLAAIGWGVLKCNDIETEAIRPTKYSVVSGCYVQIDGKWIPAERWRGAE